MKKSSFAQRKSVPLKRGRILRSIQRASEAPVDYGDIQQKDMILEVLLLNAQKDRVLSVKYLSQGEQLDWLFTSSTAALISWPQGGEPNIKTPDESRFILRKVPCNEVVLPEKKVFESRIMLALSSSVLSGLIYVIVMNPVQLLQKAPLEEKPKEPHIVRLDMMPPPTLSVTPAMNETSMPNPQQVNPPKNDNAKSDFVEKSKPAVQPKPPVQGLIGALKKMNPAKSTTVTANGLLNQLAQKSKVQPNVESGIAVHSPSHGIIAASDAMATVQNGQKTALPDMASGLPSKTGSNKVSLGSPNGLVGGEHAQINVGLKGSGLLNQEKVSGGLLASQVRALVMAQKQKLRDCYEKALENNHRLGGRLTLNWVISPVGSVTSVAIAQTDLDHPIVESCVVDVIRSVRFPVAANERATSVLYPFQFKARN